MRNVILNRVLAFCVMSAMLLGIFAATAVFANEGTILFSDDFSNLKVGAKVSVSSSDESKWSSKAESATSLLLGYDDGGNIVLRISIDEGDIAGGSRIEKRLYVTCIKD